MCPNCNSWAVESNLIDETPYRQMARSAKTLRVAGHTAVAADLLTSLASVKIINFIRARFKCASCGATFDE